MSLVFSSFFFGLFFPPYITDINDQNMVTACLTRIINQSCCVKNILKELMDFCWFLDRFGTWRSTLLLRG